MEQTDRVIRMTKEDQEAFAEAVLNPSEPNPVLAAAMRRRHELLFNHAMDVIANSCAGEGNVVLRTDEDFDNLCRDMGVDPTTLDEDGTDTQ